MINILIYFIILMIVLITCFLIFILANHFSSWRREKIFEIKKDKWEKILYSYLAEDISASAAATKIKGNYFLIWEFIKPYLANLKGDDREKIIKLARESSMVNYFYKKIRKGRRKERILAASALGKLGEQRVVRYLKEMLFSNDTAEMTFAAKAIADLKETNYLIPVFRRMLTDTFTTYEGISEIAVRFGVEICKPVKDIIQDWLDGERDLEETFNVPKEESLSLMIDILGYYRYIEAAPQLEKTLTEIEDNEVIIHIFKALYRLEYPVKVSLKSFLFHEDWIIRSQAARYIGKIEEDNYKEELKELLKDENWWVRYYATKALYNLREISYLKSLISLEGDFRAEMSKYILGQQ